MTFETLSTRFIALPGNVRGAIWILFATLFFAIMVSLIKAIGLRLPISEILLVRQAVMLLVTLPVIVRHFPDSIATRHPWAHAARTGLALVGMFCGFTAVVHLPLADATAIGFAKSFFITIFAIIFLKEVVGIRRWGAVLVGFIGVLIMVRPTAGDINVYGLVAVVGAAAAGLVMILIRYLSRFDQPITILAYQVVFVGLLIAPLAIYQWVWPTPTEMMLMTGIGIISVAAQTCNIRAFRAGEATSIAALDYVRLVWATAIGLVVFSEFPSLATLAGAALVIAASLYTVHREARRGQELARSPAGRGYNN
ncbi:MAG TPA: DMT family transporter [Afifellaceae bacterium]|nr:DMT family transporter [Afifellaceae bacterium]